MGVGTIPAPISFAQESIKKSENWAEISWLRMEGMLGCSPYHRQWNSGKMILKNKGVGGGLWIRRFKASRKLYEQGICCAA